MKPALLEWLRCPDCRQRLDRAAPETLSCAGCGRRFAVRQGVPRFVVQPSATAAAFGHIWGEQAAHVSPPREARPYHLYQLHDALGAPPLTGLIVDGGYSYGVVHHTPDPARGP